MQQVTQHVFVETEFQGCNTSFVVTSDGVVIIDTPMVPEEANQWKMEAARHGPIRYVINTEPHADHTAGNYWFGAPVIAHAGTREALEGTNTAELEKMLRRRAPQSLPLDPDFHYLLPEITFSHELTLHLGNHSFRLLNLPGHTISELAVHVIEEQVVFSGDNVNTQTPIFIQSAPHAWLTSLEKIGQMDAHWIVPGHGDVSDKRCLASMSEAVTYWIRTVKTALEKGMDIEETIALVTREKYNQTQDPFLTEVIRMCTNDLFRSLKA